MDQEEYRTLDGLALAELIRTGEITREEALEAARDRCRAINPTLNAVTEQWEEPVSSDSALQSGHAAFAGVPTLIKDNLAIAGKRTTWGSNLLAENTSPQTDRYLTRLFAAGAAAFGRTNLCEFGLLPITEPALFGPTLNPWNTAHSPGGSSGGSAAAVAAGIVPFAVGNDGGGSIRIPASACGLFGLKPSRGRNPAATPGLETGIAVNHALTRTVRDSAALLDATCGPDPGEPFRLPRPDVPFRTLVARDPKPLRVAFTAVDFTGHRAHPDCVEAVERMAAQLERLGHRVSEARPEIDGVEFNEAFKLQWSQGPGAVLKQTRARMQEREDVPRVVKAVIRSRIGFRLFLHAYRQNGMPLIERPTRLLAGIDAEHTPGDLLLANGRLDGAARTLSGFLDEYDVLLTPTLGRPPLHTGEFDPKWPIERLARALYEYVGYTPVANTGGFPAMSVPTLWTGEHLPIGTQFIAPVGAEGILFQLAGQIERAHPWAHRYSEIA